MSRHDRFRWWSAGWLACSLCACTPASVPPKGPAPKPVPAASGPTPVAVRIDAAPEDGEDGGARLSAVDAAGRPLWTLQTEEEFRRAVLTPDGGAVAIVVGDRSAKLLGIDPRGMPRWEEPAAGADALWSHEGVIFHVRLERKQVLRRRLSPDGTAADLEPFVVARPGDPRGHSALEGAGPPYAVAIPIEHGELQAVLDEKVGQVLFGDGAGRLCSVGFDGPASWHLGLRDRITSIRRDSDDAFAVVTADGQTARVRPDGALRAAPPPPSWTAPLTFRREVSGPVVSLLVDDRGVAALTDRGAGIIGGGSAAGKLWLLDGGRSRSIDFYGASYEQARVFDTFLSRAPDATVRVGGLAAFCCGETSVGIWRLSGSRWVADSALENLVPPGYPAVAFHSGGTPGLFCSVSQGNAACHVGQQGRWVAVPPPPHFESAGSTFAARRLQGQVWAVYDSHIAKLEAGRWQSVTRLPAGQEGYDYDAGPTRLARDSAGALWLVRNGKLFQSSPPAYRWQQQVVPGLGPPSDVWAAAPDDIWVVGTAGAFRYDGRQWLRVWGLPRELTQVTGRAPADVWVAGRGGLWHGTAPPPRIASPPAVAKASPWQRLSSAPRPLTVEPDSVSYLVTDVELSVPGKPPLDTARGVATGPSGVVWFYDAQRLVQQDGEHIEQLATEGLRQLPCHHCVAPASAGNGHGIWHGLLRRLTDGTWGDAAAQASDLLAIDARGSDATWAVAGGPDRTLPRVLRRTASGWQPLRSVPDATYAAVAARSRSLAWLAGGVSRHRRDGVWWPVGDGLLVQARPDSARVIQLPGSTLLAVAAPADDEAWAVGYDGRIVHVRGDQVEQLELDTAPWLTSVWAKGKDDVWIGGEHGTLLRWTGAKLVRVPLGRPRLTITGLTGTADGTMWAVGPQGIVRIRAR